MKENESKVISIDSKAGFTFKKFRPEEGHCFHKNVIVDEEKRQIECEKCGLIMDAFDYLRNCCYEENNAFNRLELLTVEVRKLEIRYRNLTKEVERLNKIKKQS